MAGGCRSRYDPAATAATSGCRSPHVQKSGALTSSQGVPPTSAATTAPRTRHASTGRDAGWVERLDSPDRSTASARSRCHAIGTGASRISDPLAAASWSTWGSTASPVRRNRASCPLTVIPMSKQRPFDDR